MTCDIFNIDQKDLECRKIIMQSIERALKRGDEVFDNFVSKDQSLPKLATFGEFKDSLKNIDHQNLKK